MQTEIKEALLAILFIAILLILPDVADKLGDAIINLIRG